ncbi:MAG: hypothetical protein PVG07_03185 [Acidobacteriota bacterium]
MHVVEAAVHVDGEPIDLLVDGDDALGNLPDRTVQGLDAQVGVPDLPFEPFESLVRSLFEPVESLFEPVESLFEPVESLFEPIESLFEPVESLFEPVESLLEPIESLLEPVESLLGPIESLLEPVESLLGPIESLFEPVESLFEPVESLFEPVELSSESIESLPVFRARFFDALGELGKALLHNGEELLIVRQVLPPSDRPDSEHNRSRRADAGAGHGDVCAR